MMMQIIFDALNDLDTTDQVSDQVSDQVEILLNCMGNEVLSATQLMQRLDFHIDLLSEKLSQSGT